MTKRVLVVGDAITDIHRHGQVTRICPEAPVPIWVEQYSERKPGGMRLVADNLAAFGIEVSKIEVSHSEKVRFWAGRHLLLREDRDELASGEFLLDSLAGADAVVISDYNKTDGQWIESLVGAARCSGIPIYVDSKRADIGLFGDAIVFPNQGERLNYPRYRHMVQKRGGWGCEVDGVLVPTEPVEAFDVTGAGDVFLAAFVAAHLSGADLMGSARAANYAAGLSVRHIGGYVLTAGEANESLRAVGRDLQAAGR